MWRPLLTILLVTAPLLLSAAEDDLLFATMEPLSLTLVGPFDRIDDERDKEQEYEGLVRYEEGGQSLELNVRYQVRGNWRLNPRNCSYSQLWLDLRRGQLPGTVFENQNRLKLVVQCRRQDRYQEYLDREMRAYQIFDLLTDYDFDVRPLQVTYQDSETEDSRTHQAFFIEHQNRVAALAGMEEVEENRIEQALLDPMQSTIASLFMFLLGNTDFSLIQGPEGDECCHNAKLIKDSAGVHYPIPYDFDASGFVDASYAPEPNPDFNLRSNRSRLFRGFCVEREVFDAAADLFLSHRAAIEALVTDRRNIRFVEDFFETLTDPRDFERDIVNDCR